MNISISILLTFCLGRGSLFLTEATGTGSLVRSSEDTCLQTKLNGHLKFGA